MKPALFAKKESIGQPELFSGRARELRDLLDWIDLIPKEQAKSRSLLATKKMGKTAILDRLFNILFARGMDERGQVIPFFFRVGEQKISQADFGEHFYFSFLTQYLAFKCKKPGWVNNVFLFPKLQKIAQETLPGDPTMESVVEDLEQYAWLSQSRSGNRIWEYASSAPHRIASNTNAFILQILDEFQYLNKYVFDNNPPYQQIDLAGTYHQWAESRIAPQLISGSWVGWLKEILRDQLNPRFKKTDLTPFSDEEALQCVYNYAKLFNTELSEASALAIQSLSRNHPYYISCLIRSDYRKPDGTTKDLCSISGVEEVLRFEVNHKSGEIFAHWNEYIHYAFGATNGKTSKAIVLFLSKDRYQEKTRPEIAAYLRRKALIVDDEALETTLKWLARSDIIEEGSTAFRFKGIPDDLFNQVFQVLYAEEVENTLIAETLDAIVQEDERKRKSVNEQTFKNNKGYFLEFMMERFIKYKTVKKDCPALYQLIQNAPENAQGRPVQFHPYQTVGEQHHNVSKGYHVQFDVYAKAVKQEHPSLVVECKYEKKPIGSSEVENFSRKLKALDAEGPLLAIFYSVSGFTKPAVAKMKKEQISWSTPDLWDLGIKNSH